MSVCAKHSGRVSVLPCVTIQRPLGSYYYSLSPGGHVTVHFNQLVVADTVTISKFGLLTLCEVDVLGTKVVLTPEGIFIYKLYFHRIIFVNVFNERSCI